MGIQISYVPSCTASHKRNKLIAGFFALLATLLVAVPVRAENAYVPTVVTVVATVAAAPHASDHVIGHCVEGNDLDCQVPAMIGSLTVPPCNPVIYHPTHRTLTELGSAQTRPRPNAPVPISI